MSDKLKSYTAFCVSILCLMGAVIVQFTLNFNQYLSDTLPITVFEPIPLFIGGLLVFCGVIAFVYGSHVLSTLHQSAERLSQWQSAVLRVREKLVLFRWPAPLVSVVYGFFASSFVVLFTLLVLLTTTVMVPQTTGLLEKTAFHGISSFIMTIGVTDNGRTAVSRLQRRRSEFPLYRKQGPLKFNSMLLMLQPRG